MNHAVRAAATAAVVALLAVAAVAPACAQSSDVWVNQKTFDMRSHDRNKAYDRRATEHYEQALAYVQTVQTLTEIDERSPRQEKKLQKAYTRAREHLDQAIKVSPDFVAARMMLGALHYRMKEYAAARDAYQGVLEVEPDNQDAQAYLSSVEYQLQRSEGEATDGGG